MIVQSTWYMKRLLESKKSFVSYMKPWTEARNNRCMKYHSKLTYQLSFWNVSRKEDYHAGGKSCIAGVKLVVLKGQTNSTLISVEAMPASSAHYSATFQTIKRQDEKVEIEVRQHWSLQQTFPLRDKMWSIMKAKPRAPGPDGIHNNLLKHHH